MVVVLSMTVIKFGVIYFIYGAIQDERSISGVGVGDVIICHYQKKFRINVSLILNGNRKRFA